METIGFAVIGAGYWGPNLVRNVVTHPAYELRWISDLDQEAAERAGRGLTTRVTQDLDDVWSDYRVDAVAIATPPQTHHEIARAAIEAGKHVLIEKPLATNLDQGLDLVRLAEDRRVVVMCDHTFCHTGSVLALREMIRSGRLGSLLYYDSVRVNLGLVKSDTDVFWDLAPHDLSILDFILPPNVLPQMVSAHGSDPIGVGQSCVGYVSLYLTNGAIAHLHLNWLSPTKVRTTIVGGSEKMVVWNDLEPAQRLNVFDSGVDLLDLDANDRRRAMVSYRVGEMVAPVVDGSEPLYRVVDEFARSVATGESPSTDGWSGVRVLAQLQAIDESRRQNGTAVEVDTKWWSR
jgi:predicted dehydrogenase